MMFGWLAQAVVVRVCAVANQERNIGRVAVSVVFCMSESMFQFKQRSRSTLGVAEQAVQERFQVPAQQRRAIMAGIRRSLVLQMCH